MKLNKLTPMLYTSDLQGTIDFYVKTLGFKCKAFDKELGWSLLQLDNVEIMLSLPNNHIPFDKSIFTGSFYFNTEGVNELWTQLKDKASVAYPLEDYEYGMREFAIQDNNGYLLQFGQEINNNLQDDIGCN
jgi:uncharacterized glyoxalase superfamily protein PhnB